MSSSVVANAGEPCLVVEGTSNVASATKGAVDRVDRGVLGVREGLVGRFLCRCGVDEANQTDTKMGFSTRVPMESAQEAWLCSVVELLCT